MVMDRRQFAATAIAAMALPTPRHSQAAATHGIDMGVQSFSFHEITQGGGDAIDLILDGCRQAGVDGCELWWPHAEPFSVPAYGAMRWKETPSYKATVASGRMPEARALSADESRALRTRQREWREHTPAGYFESIRKRFRERGVKLIAYNYSFNNDMSDAELEYGFKAARALGVDLITASSTISAARRVPALAERHKVRVAWHGHVAIDDPDALAGPESLLTAQRLSPWFRINLDCAHFSAAGFDPVAFIREHHDVMTHIHLHDTKKGLPEVSTANGEGAKPIREVLALLKAHPRWRLPVYYEYEWVGTGSSVDAIRQDLAYFRQALEARA